MSGAGRGSTSSARAIAAACVLCAWLALAGGRAAAEPTDADRAQRAVRGWLSLSERPVGATPAPAVGRVDSYTGGTSDTLFHVVTLRADKSTTASGFVVVSGDDLVEPVVCFSDRGAFEASEKNPLYVMLKRDLTVRLGEARGQQAAARRAGQAFAPAGVQAAARTHWSRFEAAGGSALSLAAVGESGISGIGDVRVAPLLSSTWSQTVLVDANGDSILNSSGNEIACYNYYTPNSASSSGITYSDGSASNYYCGCVATAMAQLMRYFQYPVVGVGSVSNTIYVEYTTSSRGGTATVSAKKSLRGGDGSGGAYDWSSMTLAPGASVTSTQRKAIGALCYDAGIAVGMTYSADGSGAWVFDVPSALKNYFKYGNAICASATYNDFRGFTSTVPSGYLAMVDANLDAGLPVIFGIYTSDYSGHCIVCDGYGYDSAGSGALYHHLNIGWGGYGNAWYNLPTIVSSGYAFSIISDCIYNVFESGTGEVVSGRVLKSDGTAAAGVTVTATNASGSAWNATANSNGIYAFVNLPSAASYTLVPVATGYSFASRTVSLGTSVSNPWATEAGYATNNSAAVTGDLWGVNFTATAIPILSVTPSAATSLAGAKSSVEARSIVYTVLNSGAAALTWTATVNKDWVVLSKSGGTGLAAGSSDTVTATINGAAGSLTSGTQTATVTFVNTGNAANTVTRTITLTLANAADPAAWTLYR